MNITVVTPPSNFSGVYLIRCVPTGRVYVGSARRIAKRWRDHVADLRSGKHHSSILQRAWAKYGADAFEFEVLERCAESDLLSIEQRYIDALGASDRSRGFNMRADAASNLGHRFTGQALQNIREASARRAKPELTAEHRLQLAARMVGNTFSKGYRHTAETRARLREISAKPRRAHLKTLSMEGLAKRALKRGQPLSEAHRAKISDALAGKPKSETHRRALSAVQLRADADMVERIRSLRAVGMSYVGIAEQVGCSKSMACRVALQQGGYA